MPSVFSLSIASCAPGKTKHLLLAIGGEAVGDANGEIVGQGAVAGCRECNRVPGFSELQPPCGFRIGPEVARESQHRGCDLLRLQLRQLCCELFGDRVLGDLGPAIGRENGVVHVDQHGAGQWP